MENDQAEWLASLVQQTSLEDIQSIATKMPTDIVKDFQVRRLKWAEFEVLVLTQPGKSWNSKAIVFAHSCQAWLPSLKDMPSLLIASLK